MENWLIGEVVAGYRVEVNPEGVLMRGAARVSVSGQDTSEGDSAEESWGSTLFRQLLEMEVAEVHGDDLVISFEDYSRLPSLDIKYLHELIPPSPFQMKVTSQSSLGLPSFSLNLKWLLNGLTEAVEVRGCFLKHRGKIFILSEEEYNVLHLLYEFESLSPDGKTAHRGYELFASLKEAFQAAGVLLDKYLDDREVLIPETISVDLVTEPDDRKSLVPEIDGVDREALEGHFKTTGRALDVYEVRTANGGNGSIVLGPGQREAIDRMAEVSHLKNEDAFAALSNPGRFFDGLGEVVDLDRFSKRVYGIGSFPFVATPFVKESETGIFADVERVTGKDSRRIDAGLVLTFSDGRKTEIKFDSEEDLLNFQETVHEAVKAGKRTIQYGDHTLGIDDELVRNVDALKNACVKSKSKSDDHREPPDKYLLILTNENSVDFKDPLSGLGAEEEFKTTFERPISLKSSVKLKVHQQVGVAWLQHNYNLKRQGCLLADDMGLGKTLQILTFMSWLIEKGEGVVDNGKGADGLPRYNPILIVAPLILIESETWLKDMRKFFDGDGSVFTPWLTLRPDTIKKFRKQPGKETVIGSPTLDLDELCKHRVILTNYETIVSYQHSFASMHNRWSAVITDEAQAYKMSSTRISHALKSLSPRFRIAATGTPVETRLADVWNIFDFLQPGELLGSASDFRQKYDRSVNDPVALNASIEALKERLNFGRKNAFLLRRDKRELTDLPKRFDHRLECFLSSEQIDYHKDILRRASVGGDGNHAFTLVGEFLRLYQHSALVPRYEPKSALELIAGSTKVQVMLDKLAEIASKSEKALIFTRSLDMQQILVAVLKHRFGILPQIVNGSTKKGMRGEVESGSMTRRAIIERFQESSGFNVLILSPDVAGMGLTLTEANHVFHYGRWWNPAKESQATDRVYRIGQEKDVHLYYLIAKDPAGQLETFDEKLDRLLGRRLAMASDFLAPKPSEEDLQKEFLGEMFS